MVKRAEKVKMRIGWKTQSRYFFFIFYMFLSRKDFIYDKILSYI